MRIVLAVLALATCIAVAVLLGADRGLSANDVNGVRGVSPSPAPSAQRAELPRLGSLRTEAQVVSLAGAFEATAIYSTLSALPAAIGLQQLGPLRTEALNATIEQISDSLAIASRKLEEHSAVRDPDLNTQWAIHQKRYTCLKYSCELACLQAGLYWTFEPGAAFKLNRELNEAVDGKCWFIHLSTRSNGNRLVGVVVYVPHELFPEIESQRREQQAFVKANNLQNR